MNITNGSAIEIRAARAAEAFQKIEALTAELLACRDLGTAKSLTLRIRLAADSARKDTREIASMATSLQATNTRLIDAIPMTTDPLNDYVHSRAPIDPPAPMDDVQYMMNMDTDMVVTEEVTIW